MIGNYKRHYWTCLTEDNCHLKRKIMVLLKIIKYLLKQGKKSFIFKWIKDKLCYFLLGNCIFQSRVHFLGKILPLSLSYLLIKIILSRTVLTLSRTIKILFWQKDEELKYFFTQYINLDTFVFFKVSLYAYLNFYIY